MTENTKSISSPETGFSSITSMYPSSYGEFDAEIRSMIMDKFIDLSVKDFLISWREHDINAPDISDFIENLDKQYYFLYEIDCKKLKEELVQDSTLNEKVQAKLREFAINRQT